MSAKPTKHRLHLALGLLLAACAPAQPDNRPPTVSAGDDQSVQTPEVALNGVASDPDGDTLTTSWSQTGGPEGVVFVDEAALQTTATLPETGVL